MESICIFLVNEENKEAKQLAEKLHKTPLKHGSIIYLTSREMNTFDSNDFRLMWFEVKKEK